MNNTVPPASQSAAAREAVAQSLRELKQEFHALMNGPVSRALRERGLAYRTIYGVELPRLQQIAAERGRNHALAQALWKEDVRECRLLAPMVQPPETFPPELADVWVETMHYSEEAEVCAMHLLSLLPYAPSLAFEWIAAEGLWQQVCGYATLARLFMQGMQPNERAANELLDQAAAALSAPQAALRHSALAALNKFAGFGPQQAFRVEKILG